MKSILFFLLSSFLITGFKTIETSSLEVSMESCKSNRKYSDWVYLLKEGVKIDSVETLKYKDFILFQSLVSNRKFKFKGLAPGEYSIKYTPRFNFDSLVSVQIIDSDRSVQICYDAIPESAYNQTTLLDNLTSGDTLFVNAYIASGGEFGGYDEGLWIWKERDLLKAQFYSLANSDPLSQMNNLVKFYSENRKRATPISKEFILTEEQRKDIKHFLIETKNYRKERGSSNAPEFITVYNSSESYQITEHDFRWRPYLQLKEKLTSAAQKTKSK